MTDLAYATMSMCGEAGEVAEKVKRIYRGDNEAKDPFYDRQIAAELGDVLWCLAAVCTALDIPLEQVAVESLKKMDSRAKRGVLKGSGDNRQQSAPRLIGAIQTGGFFISAAVAALWRF